MADYFWGCIEIGGDLEPQHVTRFSQEAQINPEELPEHLEDGHFVVDDSEARYGLFEELEDLCQELGLPYTRQSDGMYDFSPEIVYWQPGMSGADHVLTDHDSNPVVDMDRVREIRDALRNGQHAEALKLADAAVVEFPEIPLFRLV